MTFVAYTRVGKSGLKWVFLGKSGKLNDTGL